MSVNDKLMFVRCATAYECGGRRIDDGSASCRVAHVMILHDDQCDAYVALRRYY